MDKGKNFKKISIYNKGIIYIYIIRLAWYMISIKKFRLE